MDVRVLAALAEPNRLRIVELLADGPRAVGEIADRLDLRQPQVTKHLQALERAGLVLMRPLGQRRIYALQRSALRELHAEVGRFSDDHPSEGLLEQYQRAIEAEPVAGPDRTLAFARYLPASPARVWRSWTTAAAVRRWWRPEHFAVAECVVRAVPDGPLRIVLAEGDGARHVATGRFITLVRPREIAFDLAPIDAGGATLFQARHEVSLTGRGAGTGLRLSIAVSGIEPGAAPAVAGLEFGWQQLLDHLTDEVARDANRART